MKDQWVVSTFGESLAAVLSSVLIQLFASFPYRLACPGDPAAQEFEFGLTVLPPPPRSGQTPHRLYMSAAVAQAIKRRSLS
jgi:hypothetical protein